jgi:hypothetical protein
MIRVDSYTTYSTGALVLSVLILAAACSETEPVSEPAGAPKGVKTKALETGAALLQTNAPLAPMDVYLVGFHPARNNPSHQMEAHHFCHQVNEDFAQCALFDGNTEQANLIGIEYIVSEELFESLPARERQYWHPHNYEILSGQLVAPGIPEVAEHELMESKMNSYGKTWHVWDTGNFKHKGDELPLGQPMLMWSFNRDGEAMPGLIENRDKRLDMSTEETRRARADLVPLAKPQTGVDALQGRFPGPSRSIPGVESTR